MKPTLVSYLSLIPALAGAGPMIVAHRGSSYEAPENTLAAVNLGWKQNSDAVEIDVHLSRDNKLVIIHDATTSRTATAPLVVKKTDYAEIRELDAGGWKSSKYAGEKMPTLEEVLATIPGDKKLFIEIKSERDTVPFVRDAVEKAGKVANSVIIAFDIDVAADAKKALPSVPVFWLKSTEKQGKAKKHLPHGLDVLQTAKSRGLDGVDLQYQGVTQKLVDAARKEGLQLHVWTVDDPEDARRLADMGVDSITTNRPDVMLETLAPAAAAGAATP